MTAPAFDTSQPYATTDMGLQDFLRRQKPLGSLQAPMAGPTPFMPGVTPSVTPGANPGMSIALPPPAAGGPPSPFAGFDPTGAKPPDPNLPRPPNINTQPPPSPGGMSVSPAGAVPSAGTAPLGPLSTPQPTTPWAATSPFGPGSSLIGTQISPEAQSPLAGPDRLAIAEGALKTFDEQQADQEKLGVQDIGREAAAAGRLGSGMVSTSLGDLQTQLAKARLQEERGLAGDVAGQTLNDRLAVLSGEQSLRGEQRGERGYQATLDQQALENRLRQFGLEQGAQAQDFSQQYDTEALLAQLGFGGNTAGTLGDVASTYAGQSTDLTSGAGDILRRLFAQQQPVPTYSG